MPTVDIQFATVRFELYLFGRLLTFKKVTADDLCQASAKGVQRQSKAFRAQLSKIVLGLIKPFRGLRELFQLIWSSISEVDVSDKNISKW